MDLPDKFDDRWQLIAATVLPIMLLIVVVTLFQIMAPTAV